MVARVGVAEVELRARESGFRRTVDSARTSLTRLNTTAATSVARQRTLTATTSRTSAAFRTLRDRATGLGTALIAGFGVASAVRQVSQLEQAIVRLQTQVGLSAEQSTAARTAILRAQARSGVAAQDLAQGVFNLASAGVEYRRTIGLVAQASAVGLGSATELGSFLGASWRQFGDELGDINTVLPRVLTTIRRGRLDAAELARNVPTFGSTARAAGTSFNDALASFAVVSQVNNPSVAATNLNSFYRQIANPSPEAITYLESIGSSIQELQRISEQEGLAALVERLQELQAIDPLSFRRILPDASALDAFRVLSTNLGVLRDVRREITDTPINILDAEQTRVQATAAGRLSLQLGELRSAFQSLATRVLPFVTEGLISLRENFVAIAGVFATTFLLRRIRNLSEAFGGLVLSFQGLVNFTRRGAFAARVRNLIHPEAISRTRALATNKERLLRAIKPLAPALGLAGGAVGLLGGILFSLFNLIDTNRDGVDELSKSFTGLKDSASEAQEAIVNLFNANRGIQLANVRTELIQLRNELEALGGNAPLTRRTATNSPRIEEIRRRIALLEAEEVSLNITTGASVQSPAGAGSRTGGTQTGTGGLVDYSTLIQERLENRRAELFFAEIETALADQIQEIPEVSEDAVEALSELEQAINSATDNFSRNLVSVIEGAETIGDAFRNLVADILRSVLEQQVTQPASNALGQILNSAITSFIGGAGTPASPRDIARPANTFNAAPRQYGGYTDRGLTLVGEAGPELLDLRTPGRVYSNDELLGVSNRANFGNISVVVNEAETPRATADAIRQELQRDMLGIIGVYDRELHKNAGRPSPLREQLSRG